MPKGLRLKQKRFVDAYLRCGNASEAAARAGYDQVPEALRVTACRLLTNANIKQRIQERLNAEAVAATEILQTLASHVRADITDLFDETGILDLQTIRERGLGHLIKKIKMKRRYERDGEQMVPVDELEIEVHNPQTAAAQICKMMGWEQMPALNDRDREAAEDALKFYIEQVAEKEGRVINKEQAIEEVKGMSPHVIQALASTAVQ